MSDTPLTDEALLTLIEHLGHDVPASYIDELANREGQIETRLIELLDKESTWTCASDDPARWMPVHLLLALGKRSSEEAGLAIARAVLTCER